MDYNFREWNVKLIQEPNELMTMLKSFNLKGKTIKNIKLVGMCYNLTEEMVIDNGYHYFEDQNIAENKESLFTYNSIPDEIEFDRYAQIDEPIIIEFEDGDRLEIDYSEESSLKIGLNSLPKTIKYGCNIDNVDGNILFSNCIGKKIKGFEVLMKDELDVTNCVNVPNATDVLKNQESYIVGFKILLTDFLEIKLNNWFDFGEVTILERPNTPSKITWEELKKGMKKLNEKVDYNEQENEIINGIHDENIDISRIDFLLKNGADVNAQSDKTIEDDYILDSLFQTIITNDIDKSKIDLVKLLQCFIENGLDINKFGPSIISDFHHLAITNQDIYKMTKMLLNSVPTKMNINVSKREIALEASWLTCSYPDDYVENPDRIANKLDGLNELLEKYEQGEDYNAIYDCNHIIGQTFEKIYLSGNFKILENNRIEYQTSKKHIPQLYTVIQCNQDNLLVKDNYLTYIDNDREIIGENEFTKEANKYLKGEIIENIEFKHYSNKYGIGRTCEIYFSNKKKIIYGTIENTTIEYLQLI